MGIGRREFLKFAGMALGGAVFDPMRTIAANGDYYVNMRLGLGFQKPHLWHFDAFKDFGTLLKGQVVENVEPEYEEAFRKDQTSTLVAVVAKYDWEVTRFSPSITVFKNAEDRGNFESLDDLIDGALTGFAEVLKDFEVIDPPAHCELSNCSCVRLKSRWLFQHEKILPTVIHDETLVIDQAPVLYTIHLYDAPSVGDVAEQEFRQFVRSLRIA